MKVSFKGDYALKTLLALALNYQAGIMTINDLSQQMDIPKKFLEQILLELKKGGFVESKRGKEGGYLLARRPIDITVGEVVRQIDGPIEPIACVDRNYKGCRDIYTCLFRDIWVQTSQAVNQVIDHITFEELVKNLRTTNGIMDFVI